MTDERRQHEDLFEPLPKDQFEKVQRVSEGTIRQAIAEGWRDLRRLVAAPRPARVEPRLRYR
jgi:hypothetical protein